jgi:ribonuclease HI
MGILDGNLSRAAERIWFQGAFFCVDGSCKDGTMGSGCCKFQGEEADKCARVSREEEGKSSNRAELLGIVLALQSTALSEDVYYCAITQQSCVLSRGG